MTEKKKKQKEKETNYLVFHVDGGIGKNIMATAVAEGIAKRYPEKKIIVVTAWEAVWYHNPHIYRVYTFGNLPYFYDDYIFDETKIFRFEPYHTESFIKKKCHLIESWDDMYDIPYDNEEPSITLTPREIEFTRDKVKPDGRPIFILQTNGGAENQYSKKSWARDLPLQQAQQIVNYFNDKKYRILHLRREDQPALNNVETVTLPLREAFSIFALSQKRLLIDSFAQHLCKALNLKSTVCWIGNNKKVFGYDMHDNIEPKAEHKTEFLKYSYLDSYEITGNIQQFPYKTLDLFDVDKIIKSIEKQ